MADKERRINERSLENLKLGAQARYQGKIRQNVSILPETAQWLKCSGNASGMIDDLVAAARNGGLKSNYTHEQIEAEQQVSNSVYEEIAAARNGGLKSSYTHEQIETEQSQSNSVYEEIEALKAEAQQLRSQLAALELENAKLIDVLAESEHLYTVPNQSQELSNQELPDYEAARDRALAKLKRGSQAPEYKRAKKAMDLLLDELRG